jgi:FemAB family
MQSRQTRPLGAGYQVEIDSADDNQWDGIVNGFEDANIYQTRPYGTVTVGENRVSHLVLKRGQDVVAAVQARIAKVPLVGAGIAYIRWGPLWKRRGVAPELEVFRQSVRALRNEYVCRRGLVVRLLPVLFSDDPPELSAILAEEGFLALAPETRGRTILMSLAPSLPELREGMNAHWKRELKVGERGGLEIVEGTGTELFDTFIAMYKEMVARKQFVEPNDIYQFRQIQTLLSDRAKMGILLCKSGEELCSGMVYSMLGNSAVYIFGATSNAGMKSRGSYILQWKTIETLKARGCEVYNLNGINPANNPGTYKFKNDLAGRNGRDVYLLGTFDAYASPFNYRMLEYAEQARKLARSAKARIRAYRSSRLQQSA